LDADVVVDHAAPFGKPLRDVAGVMQESLARPLNYPSLAAATVPGDRVAIALEPGIPQVEKLLVGAIQALLEASISPRDITVVTASNVRAPLSLLPRGLREDVQVVLHNPSDQTAMQYLAADQAARPIYLNRALCDADFVLPLGMPRLPTSLDFVGGYSAVFPTFADLATQRRFHAPSAADHDVHQRRREQETDGAAWQLGVHFLVQVVPGGGQDLLHVVAGEAASVVREAQRLHADAWQYSLSQRVGMVVAAISGDDEQQSWEPFARSLYCAMQAAAEGAAIVLVTDLQSRPGQALQCLAGNERGADLQRQIAKTHATDALAAAVLAEARERFDVYLLSGLASDTVEDLGIGHIATGDEIARLARQHSSILLLGNAQHAVCKVNEHSAVER
jgi:hypothetical protein